MSGKPVPSGLLMCIVVAANTFALERKYITEAVKALNLFILSSRYIYFHILSIGKERDQRKVKNYELLTMNCERTNS
jgi:hypothetical protein